MKKFVLTMAIALASIFTGQAEGWYAGGAFALGDNDGFVFRLAPEVGYHYNEKWAFGGELDYSYIWEEHNFAIAPYARYKFYQIGMATLFVDGTIGISTGTYSDAGFQIGFRPGALFKVSENISLVTKVGFVGYRNDYGGSDMSGIDLSTENISLGFHVEF